MLVRSTQIALLLALQVAWSTQAFAVKMDETTHDAIIKRLEISIDDMDDAETEKPGIQARLGDLYSDRARLKAMNEMANNCQNCHGAKDDRKRAIQLYDKALPKISKSEQGRVTIQIAHLYNLNGEANKASDLYTKILKAPAAKYSSEVRGIANASVGEILFKKGEFSKALKNFEIARREKVMNRGLLESRIAWCQLNLGQNERAVQTLINLLKSPELSKTQTTEGNGIDPSFLQDASADLAKFLARVDVGAKQISLLRDLSPNQARKTNLHILATETDRLGKKQASLLVWEAYVEEGDIKPTERLEVQIHVAQILYDMNKQALATQAYAKAIETWKKNGCSDKDLCEDIQKNMRRFVTGWNKAQKDKPSKDLFAAYKAFLTAFPEDTEMTHWAAIVGRDMGRHKEAAELFHRASIQAAEDLKKDPKNKVLANIFEGSLLGEIEMAEASKDLKTREAAYNYYLNVNSKGSQAVEVRYQRAQVFYDSGRLPEAFSEFHYIATLPGKDHRDLKLKSADLALDCLVSLKDDKSLQIRSLEYARIFSERKSEYAKISRNATMNIVAADLKNQKSADKADYRASLAALNQVNLDDASDAEKIKVFKNRIIIAQKMMDLKAVNQAADQLLSVKSISKTDREWALTQQVWVAELQLDFARAYHLSGKMELKDLSPADRQLRLSLLSDLAGLDSRKHNEAYLKLAKDTRAANLVRVTLVKNSSRPWRELEKQLPQLKKTPDLLAGLTLEVFSHHRDLKKAERVLKTTNIRNYPAGRTLARQFEMKDFYAFDKKIRSHRIYGYSDRVMQTTLKERLKLLAQSDRRAQASFKTSDWTLQVMSLTQLSRENRRLYGDILALPVPSRLNAQQKQQYKDMLKSQSQPYLARAEKIEGELNNMWSGSNSMQNLQAAYMTASPDLQRVYRDEINDLISVAPSNAKSRLQNLLNTPYSRPSQKDLLTARRDLQADPFDISKAKHLRDLEAQTGRPSMVAYLDERISQLKKGKSL